MLRKQIIYSDTLANAHDLEYDALEYEDGDCFDEKNVPILFSTFN